MRADLLLDDGSPDAAALVNELDSAMNMVNRLITAGADQAGSDALDAQLKKVITAGRKVIGHEWQQARKEV